MGHRDLGLLDAGLRRARGAFRRPGAWAYVPVIIVSGTIGRGRSGRGTASGCSDFIVKGRLTRLVSAGERELREKAGREAKRLAEDRARESEDRYRLLFETCPLPMCVHDLEALAFLAVNEAAVEHYGYSREDFGRMTLADIRPPKDVGASRRRAPRHWYRRWPRVAPPQEGWSSRSGRDQGTGFRVRGAPCAAGGGR